MPRAFRPWSWSRLRRVHGLGGKTVIVTVDGGLDNSTFEKGLDVLSTYGIRATFFLMTGPMMRTPKGRAVVERLVAEGHELGNHTVDHPKLSKKTDEQARQQLLDAERWVEKVTGLRTMPLLREPYLDRDDRIDKLSRKLCYRSIWFTVYTRDDTAGVTAQEIIDAVLLDGEKPRKLKSGSILMFHASQKENLKAWPIIFSALRAKGHRFMPLGEALRRRAASKRRRRR